MLRRSLIAASLVAAVLGLAPSADAFVFWANRSAGAIGRSDINGVNYDPTFITGANDPCGVAVDSKYVYWANRGSNTIGRATLDGTNVDQSYLPASDPCGPSILAVGSTEWLYWGNAGSDTIARVQANGLNGTQDLIGPPFVNEPTGTAGMGNQIYWSNADNQVDDGTIGTAHFDGTVPGTLVPVGTTADPQGVAVNGTGVYWANLNGGTIGYVNPFLSPPNPALVTDGQGSACGIAATEDDIYWGGVDSIGTAFANGNPASVQPDWISGIGNVCGVAADADEADAVPVPGSLDFGDVPVGSGPTGTEQIAIQNSQTTSVDLNVSAAAAVGPDATEFTVTGGGCSAVAPGASCLVDVSFDPARIGGQTADVQVVTNDPTDPIMRIPLSGTGTTPDQSVSPGSLNFGDRLVGTTSSPQLITLTNGSSASGADVIHQAELLGPGAGGFSIVSDTCSNQTLQPGDSCQVGVTFAPQSTGDLTASIAIPSDDPVPTASVALHGTGTQPDEDVSPSALQFGPQHVGTQSATQIVTVGDSTDGTGPLIVGSIGLAGTGAGQFDLAFDQCSGASMQPGDQCQVGVRFRPSSVGSAQGDLEIPSNGSSSPSEVSLGGTATAAPVTASFSLGKPRRLRHGRALIPVAVPGPGAARLSGRGVRPRAASSAGPGTVLLSLRPRGATRRALQRRHSVRVRFTVTFTPPTGAPAVLAGRIRLRP